MRIKFRSPEDKKINLIFPTSIIFSRFTVNIMKKYAPQIQELNANDMQKLFALIRKTKRKHPHLELISIESANGENVKIFL